VRHIEFTWWAEDGSERRGRVSIASHASPDTVAALARMMRLAQPDEAGASGAVRAAFWLNGSWDAFDGPQEERY